MDDEKLKDAWGVTGRKAECKSCGGMGTIDGDICPGCRGYGWLSERADLE